MTDPIEILRGIVAKLEEGIAAASWPPDSAIFRALDDARSLLASPPAPAAQDERAALQELIAHFHLSNWTDEQGDGLPLVDRITSGGTIAEGLAQIELLADEIAVFYAERTAQPAVPVLNERDAFWAWVEDRGCDTDGAWSAWQARAALSVRPSNDIADDIPGSTAAGGVDTPDGAKHG